MAHSPAIAIRRSILTFDQTRVGKWDIQAESNVLVYMLKAALTGHEDAQERGVIRIDL